MTHLGEEDVVIAPYFTLHKHQADFEEVNFHEYFDMVFSMLSPPDVQPRLWTESMLTKFYKALKPEGILSTYCVKGTVKQALRNIGFNLKRLPVPGEAGNVESGKINFKFQPHELTLFQS